jgi:hypothetical protein
MNGFVLLARKIQDNSIWRRDPDHLKLFLYLLLNANYREDKVYKYHSGDESVEVGYAQYLCSYSKISADCQYSAGNKLISWQPSRVNRMLKALEADGRIRVVGKTQMGTLVEVCNYKLFQDVSTYRLTPSSPTETRGLEDPVKTTGSKVNSDINKEIQQLWDVYLIELGGSGKKPTLTAKRKQVLGALYEEQLRDTEGYRDAFKGILKAVKSSEHHMKERAWQLPESLFRNEERRERWAIKGQEKRHQPKAHGVSRNQWSVEA